MNKGRVSSTDQSLQWDLKRMEDEEDTVRNEALEDLSRISVRQVQVKLIFNIYLSYSNDTILHSNRDC